MKSFKALADSWLHIYSLHLVEVSVFVLMVWLADSLLRLDTRARYFVWLIALTKLFFPPILSFPGLVT
jgi:hypothetical protein